MKISLIGIDEKKLSKYLVLVYKSKTIAPVKMEKLSFVAANAKIAEDRDDVKKILIEQNLKTVITTAAKYRGATLSFAELITAGNKGLISAVKKWSNKIDEDFVSYVAWNIEGNIIRDLIKYKKTVQKNR